MSLEDAERVAEEVKKIINFVNDITAVAGNFCVETNGEAGDFDNVASDLTDLAKTNYDLLHQIQGQVDQCSATAPEEKVLPPLPDQSAAVADDESFKQLNKKVAEMRSRWARAKAGGAPADGGGDGEAGEFMEGSGGPIVCPVSKKPIENPVKLLKCQHVFDRASIEGIIAAASQGSRRIRCPYWGCDHYFSQNEVTPVSRVTAMN